MSGRRYRRNAKRLSADSTRQDILDICSSPESSRDDLEMIALSCADRWWPDFKNFGGNGPDVLLRLIFKNERSDGMIWSNIVDNALGIPPEWKRKYLVISSIGDNPSLGLELLSGHVTRNTINNVIVAVYLRCCKENASFAAVTRFLSSGQEWQDVERGAHGEKGVEKWAKVCAQGIVDYQAYKEESKGYSNKQLAGYGMPPKPMGLSYEPSEEIYAIASVICRS